MSKGENTVKWIKGQEQVGWGKGQISWVTWREWRVIVCPKGSSPKNWKGRNEEEGPSKDGEKK
jgi:hypothetical protein